MTGVYTDTMERMPVEYRVSIAPTLTRDEMVDTLEVLREYGMELHGVLTDMANTPEYRRHMNMKATATYSNITDDCAKLRAQIIGRALRSDTLGKLPDNEIEALKLTYAQLLSGNLSKLKAGVDFARKHGVVDELSGKTKYWVELEMPALLNSCVSVIRHWAQVLIWQEKKGIASASSYGAIRGRLIGG